MFFFSFAILYMIRLNACIKLGWVVGSQVPRPTCFWKVSQGTWLGNRFFDELFINILIH